ncbi:thioredoxin domain-containing protein [Sanguibacter sp. 25GB23B1]|uniref:thioredoxin domain-containing protein n=1 Tax=unclassified Sanguibacter TaxID=2645534 RepID=UPI0032AEE807
MNRLATALSPYLRQHADNPVDWREWSAEAFAEARERDVPVLLSIGYAACHWCHVMAHESFEDEATAQQMNDGFVSIKVDREERPDIDSVYMAAVVAMTRQGGWPMTVFLTPEGAPFFAGTYFPPTPVQGIPSFPQVLDAVSTAWRDKRTGLEEQAAGLVEHLRSGAGLSAGHTAAPSPADLDAAVEALARQLDITSGGFGDAPKFPPSMNLEQLLRHHARTGDALSLEMAARTCEAMARGGIYDQLGGGFARYSVDAQWVVPHFEKMLYDNAQLLGVYAHLYRALAHGDGTGEETGSVDGPVAAAVGGPELVALAERVTTETAEFLLRELRTAEGGFASSLDADTDGHEGTFYVWTPAQLVEALGEDDGAWAARTLAVTPGGTFEKGSSVLQLLEPLAPADEARWSRVRAALFAARQGRTLPGRDGKVVAGWNGLAIGALAEAGRILDRPGWVAAAEAAAEHVVALHLVRPDASGPEDQAQGIELRRVSLDGQVGTASGVLEDYALLADGLLQLFSATGTTRWYDVAGDLLDVVLDRFAETTPAGALTFFDTPSTAAEGEVPLVVRPADPGDNASPSGRSAAAGALLRYAALSGSHRHRVAAEAALAVYPALALRAPRFAGHALAVAEALADGPREVAIVVPVEPAAGSTTQAQTDALVREAWLSGAPGAVIATGVVGSTHPLLADRPAAVPTAYVCRGFVCERPVTDAASLRDLLSN